MFSAASKTGSQPSAAANFIEDVFSTWLYTGNGSTQTITNGIDLAGKGGLVWLKGRDDAYAHNLYDTARGATKFLESSVINAEGTRLNGLTSFNASGFSIGNDGVTNSSAATYVSWSFREQPKFFDVVTYSGNSTVGREISHNLGSAPGMMIIKSYNQNGTFWIVYHRSLGAANYLQLSATNASAASVNTFNNTDPTSTVFTLGASTHTNSTGYNYVAYLFAHNAGGFGTSGNENVISCGSFTADGGTQEINLGFEPQWMMFKSVSNSSSWFVGDVMRGATTSGATQTLYANLSSAEVSDNLYAPTATGFRITPASSLANDGYTYIYMAIRRPMKVPTTGTSVFTPTNVSSSGDFTSTAGFPVDLIVYGSKTATDKWYWFDRLRGTGNLDSATTGAEAAGYPTNFASNTKFSQTGISGDFSSYISYDFSRRPGFFDEVCYTGTGDSTAQTHNLGVPPELVICKSRSSATFPAWGVWSAGNGVVNNDITGLSLNSNAAAAYLNVGYSSRFTTTTFRPDTVYDSTENAKNQSGQTYVAYLFATCPGVSKVGLYTGNGTTQAIACGFTGGARFVLIKRVNSTGDWYVYDTVRGMTVLTDPYLLLNSSAAEVATLGSVTTTTGGFTVDASILAAINTNAASYIFLAIS